MRYVRKEFLTAWVFRTLICIKNWGRKPYIFLSWSFKWKGKRCPILFIGNEASPLSKNLMIVYMGQHPKGS
jgi:hypothetical protein